MRLKSYYAPSVEAAMEQARAEIGGEALLLESRPSPPDASKLGAYEVVFALPENKPPSSEEPLAGRQARLRGRDNTPLPEEPLAGRQARLRGRDNTPLSEEPLAGRQARLRGRDNTPLSEEPLASPEDSSHLLKDLVSLRREMERMREAVARSSTLTMSAHHILQNAECARLYSLLLASEVSPALAQDLLVKCAGEPVLEAAGSARPASLGVALQQEMRKRIRVDSDLCCLGGRTRLVAFTGPPGAGKTSALVKLAAQYGLTSRRPMLIVSFDNCRVAASEQLRSYAAILGAGFLALETGHALRQLIEEQRGKVWIWIDTPGFGPRDMDMAEELASCFDGQLELDVHLVLSAATRIADLRLAFERYARFRPSKLLFTHLDETESLGAIYTLAAQSGKPVSFLSNGQQIPEDVEAASAERIVELVTQGMGPGFTEGAVFSAQAGRAVAGL
ncbi:MAG: hypothetical protein HY235_05595 [Acidobacteria bacterium]|nr:hypothetical protein [Acidobacteriota bacterium]